GLAEAAGKHLALTPNSRFWQIVQFQFTHTEWVGASFWDLIQPSFMFMVGVSLAYSYVQRRARGDSWWQMFAHAMKRSVLLCVLGIFLISNGNETEWSLMNVLTQIGLGYTFLFLLWQRPLPRQILVGLTLLAGVWLAYVGYPAKGIDLSIGAPDVGVTAEWAQQHLTDVPTAWHKNANLGHAVDRILLNWAPRSQAFTFNPGGYQSLNFLSSLATMLMGLICGELLRSNSSTTRKLAILLAMGVAGVVCGQIGDACGCPLVKRLWTPSWALYSGGICCVVLATLFGVIDVLRLRGWTFPFVVVGMNSIAIYAMGMLLRPWTARTLQKHLNPWLTTLTGTKLFNLEGASSGWANWGILNESIFRHCLVGMVFWLVCWWMFRRKIFLRI
ncbi:MAG: DUF5009 domain-containing protein, partial [Planctomycetota bacterium]|nr:DUF5009 domain-containing protein [Planctomycetota bacterium]